jgi:hypothetical protein
MLQEGNAMLEGLSVCICSTEPRRRPGQMLAAIPFDRDISS